MYLWGGLLVFALYSTDAEKESWCCNKDFLHSLCFHCKKDKIEGKKCFSSSCLFQHSDVLLTISYIHFMIYCVSLLLYHKNVFLAFSESNLRNFDLFGNFALSYKIKTLFTKHKLLEDH